MAFCLKSLSLNPYLCVLSFLSLSMVSDFSFSLPSLVSLLPRSSFLSLFSNDDGGWRRVAQPKSWWWGTMVDGRGSRVIDGEWRRSKGDSGGKIWGWGRWRQWGDGDTRAWEITSRYETLVEQTKSWNLSAAVWVISKKACPSKAMSNHWCCQIISSQEQFRHSLLLWFFQSRLCSSTRTGVAGIVLPEESQEKVVGWY